MTSASAARPLAPSGSGSSSSSRTRLRSRSSRSLRAARFARAFALVLLATGSSACERGCLTSWLSSKGAGPGGSPTAPLGGGSAALPLNAIDCPDGLARCHDGIVEASRVHSYLTPCTTTPEKCQCPWERVGDCDRGCVVDGVDFLVPRERALSQLCAPSAADVFARPPSPDASTLLPPPSLCEGELYRCVAGSVIACASDASSAPRALATCVRGCAEEAGFIDDELVTNDQAVALLCRH